MILSADMVDDEGEEELATLGACSKATSARSRPALPACQPGPVSFQDDVSSLQ